jgi:hypothetical protein
MGQIDYESLNRDGETEKKDPRGRPLKGDVSFPMFQDLDRSRLEMLIHWAGSADPTTRYSTVLYDALRYIRHLRGWA